MPAHHSDLTTQLEPIELTARVETLRADYFRAIPEICDERPRLVTEYHHQHQLFGKPSISALDEARAYRHLLRHRKPVVWPEVAFDRHGTCFSISPTRIT